MQVLKNFILFIGILCTAVPVLADEFLILQSRRDRVSTELCTNVTKTVPVTTRVVILGDYAEVDVARLIREEQPSVILAIGEPAFKSASKVRGIPVVAVMALSLGEKRNIPANVTGIDVRIDPARYMTLFKSLGLARIGVEYDPARSGVYLTRAQLAATQAGVELVLRPVKNPREVAKGLESLKGSASDGLWIVPDPTTVTSLNMEADFNFSIEQKKPVVSYSKEHVRQGAAVSLNLDWTRMGFQAGDMVRRLLDGATPREIPLQSPQSFSLLSNEKVLKHVGITARLDKLFPPPQR